MVFERSRIRKILVIKLRAIGDVVLSTVALPNLREAFPSAEIDFLTEAFARDAVQGNPNLSSVLAFNPKTQGGLEIIRAVRKRKYDLVFDLFGNPRSAIITRLSGAPHRVGYRFGWRKHCYSHVVAPRGGEVHNTEFNLDALRAVGIPITHVKTHFPCSSEARVFAREFFRAEFSSPDAVVALNPGGGWGTKKWRIDQFAALGDRLIEEYSVKILILWGPGEREDAETLKRLMRGTAVLVPAINLTQLGAVMECCRVLVTNDSGPMHIAAAMGTPILAIFGPTWPLLQGPAGSPAEIVRNETLSCLGCNFTACPIGNPCMEELSAERVAEAFARLVHRHSILHRPQTLQ